MLNSEFIVKKEEDINGYAIAEVGGVHLELFHYKNGNEAKEKWNERLNRIKDTSPVILKKTIIDDEDAYLFSSLPIKHKIGFYYKDLKLESIVYMNGWEDAEIRYRYNWDLKKYIREQMLLDSGFVSWSVMDFLKNKIISRVEND